MTFRSACSLLALAFAFGLASPQAFATGAAGVDGAASSPDGTNGGDEVVDVVSPQSLISATGGNGGSGYTDYSSIFGGAGWGGVGSAIATFTVSADYQATVYATGGNAGVYTYVPFVSYGGEAVARLDVTSTEGGALDLKAYQTGGKGLYGFEDGFGGSGANSIMENAVVGSTTGTLIIGQSAVGGSGGSADYGLAGNGGDAVSRYYLKDDKASSLYFFLLVNSFLLSGPTK